MDDDPSSFGSACRRMMPGAWRPRSPEQALGSPRGSRFSGLRTGGAGVTPRQVSFAGACVAEPGRWSPKPGRHACRILLFDGFLRSAFRSFGQCNVVESMSYPRFRAEGILEQDTFMRRIQTIALLLRSCQKRRFMTLTREPQSRPPTQRRRSARRQPGSTLDSGLLSPCPADSIHHACPPILAVLSCIDAAAARTSPGRTSRATGEAHS